MNRIRTMYFPLVLIGVALAVPASVGAQTKDWLPISSRELALKDNPKAPGTHAMILYREEYIDDIRNTSQSYYRVKIFTEEGKKQADVEIPYAKDIFQVEDIKARTIRPDGSIAEFNGQVFDRTIVKARGLRVQVKTFTLPDVQVGSIIEYRYRVRWDERLLLNHAWDVQGDLYTREVSFALKPSPLRGIMCIGYRLPTEARAALAKDGYIRLDLNDLAPLERESYMPPDDEVRARVSFYYRSGMITDPDEFWRDQSKRRSAFYEDYIGKRKAIQREANSIVSPADDPETKLRKLYARVQKIRNLSYERARTEKEEKRENLKDNNNAEDVLERGYGYGNQIDWLFIGLCRAVGFDASVVLTASRRSNFFKKDLLDSDQLNSQLVRVRVGDKEYWLDPGVAYAPFGMLSWVDTGVQGLVVSKDGGSFVITPQPQSSTAVTERKAKLHLETDGTLSGEVEVFFRGQEALWHRLDAGQADDTERRKDIEDEIKDWLPASAKVEIESILGWEGREEPLQVSFKLTIPEFASSTGRRLLLPLTVFQSGRRHPFASSTRLHPVYFVHPYQELDDINVELPEGLRVESMPRQASLQPGVGGYKVVGEASGAAIRVRRQFNIDGFYFPRESYSELREFFDRVRASDEQQIVLQSAASGK